MCQTYFTGRETRTTAYNRYLGSGMVNLTKWPSCNQRDIFAEFADE